MRVVNVMYAMVLWFGGGLIGVDKYKGQRRMLGGYRTRCPGRGNGSVKTQDKRAR